MRERDGPYGILRHPYHPAHPSSLHGWQDLPHRGLERADRAPSLALGPCSQCARWHLCLVSSCSFYMCCCCCCCSLLLLVPPFPTAPRIPGPGTHLPGRSWRSRSAGPDLFLTSLGSCSAVALCEQPAWQPAVGELTATVVLPTGT